MAQYRLGTVNVTNGSPVVAGAGTQWAANVTANDLFEIQGEGVWYKILSVDSDIQITLTTNYVGTTKTAQQNAIQRDFTPTNAFPTPAFGDIDTSSLIAQSLLQIDAALVALSPISSVLQGDVSVSGVVIISAASLGGVMDGVVIGSVTPAAGTFTALTSNALLLTMRCLVSALPAGVVGGVAFATNGRKTGEGVGAGTGVLVVYSNGAWRRLSDDSAVLA
jgi:hypothetical protein